MPKPIFLEDVWRRNNTIMAVGAALILALGFCLPLLSQPVTKEESEQAKVIGQLWNEMEKSNKAQGKLLKEHDDALKELEAKVNFKLNVLSSCADANFVEIDKKLEALKADLQKTRDQTAHCISMLKSRSKKVNK